MKNVMSFILGLFFLSYGFCFAKQAECNPGQEGCGNKAMSANVLQLAPLTIEEETGKSFIRIDKNGGIQSKDKASTAQSKWKHVATISKNGRVVDPKGKLLAVLRDSGILEDGAGAPLARIDPDGTIDNGSGVFVRWANDGILKRNGSSLGVKLSPAKTPARRAASIIVLLYFMTAPPTIVEMPVPPK